jgi:tetratricopeptide (TPR) repeat protein
MTNRLALSLIAGVLAILAGVAQAQDYKLQRDRCGLDGARRSPPPETIEACTAVINSGKEAPKVLAQALVNRGDAYRMGDRNIDRAIDDYTQAIRLQPDFALAFADRGFTYLFEKHSPDRAIEDLNASIRLDPTSANFFYYRGVAYADKGVFDRAIADFDQAIRLRPNFSIAYRDRGQAKLARGDRAGGDADLAAAERIGSREPACAGGAGCNR